MSAARWAAFIERRHRWIIAASLVLALGAALALLRLRLDIDVLGMLPRGAPAFDDFRTFLDEFGQLDELAVLVDGPRPAREAVAEALAARLAALPSIAAVHARIDTGAAAEALLGRYLFNYIPLAAYPGLRERLTPAGIAAQVAANKALLAAPFDLQLARTVAADPLGLRRFAAGHLAAAAGGALPDLADGWLTARDDGALLLLARPAGSPFDIAFSTALRADLEAAAAEARAAAGDVPVRIAFTGGHVFALEDAATMRADIHRYVGLALIAVLAVFWLGYGSLRVLPFVMYPLLLSTLFAFALSLLLYDELNALSLSFAAILYGLSIDSGVHFYSRLLIAWRTTGDVRAALAETLASIGRAHLASSATTATAFLVIAGSALTVVRQLGVLTAAGMAITTAQFFILYPALGVVLLRRGMARAPLPDTVRLAAWGAAAQRRRRLVYAAMGATAALCALGAARVRLDPTLARLRPADSAALRIQQEIEARFARPAAGAVVVGGATAEAALAANERLAGALRRLRDEEVLASVQAIDALLPSAATQEARLAAARALPRAAALADLDEALRAAGFRPERFRAFTETFAEPPAAVIRPGDPALAAFALALERHLRVRPDGSAQVAAYVEPAAGVVWPAAADRIRAALPDQPVAIAARPLLEHTLRGVLGDELRRFIALAVLIITVLLLALLADLRDAAAVLAVVLLPVVGVFGIMGALGLPVDPINLIVTPLLIGIGVDNGVYVVSATREHGSVAAALRIVGRPITIAALTTIAGFGCLAFATYPPLAALGALMTFGLLLCLAATITVLPALLRASVTPREVRQPG